MPDRQGEDKHLPQQKSVEEYGVAIARVFRANGYHGTTMSILSTATGLGRSSIYHHFGRGKLEMAERSLDGIACFIAQLESVADASGQEPLEKWHRIRTMLHEQYEGGELGCLLAVFGMEDVPALLREKTAELMERWFSAFASLHMQNGDVRKAAAMAQRDVRTIQGGLVVARATANNVLFKAALDDVGSNFGS